MSDVVKCNRCAVLELAEYAKRVGGVVVIHPRLPEGHPLHVPLPKDDPQGFGPEITKDPRLASGYDLFVLHAHDGRPTWITWVMSLDARCICG